MKKLDFGFGTTSWGSIDIGKKIIFDMYFI